MLLVVAMVCLGQGPLGVSAFLFKPTDGPVPETVLSSFCSPPSPSLSSLLPSLPLPLPFPPSPPAPHPFRCRCSCFLLGSVLSAHSRTQAVRYSACTLFQLTLLKYPSVASAAWPCPSVPPLRSASPLLPLAVLAQSLLRCAGLAVCRVASRGLGFFQTVKCSRSPQLPWAILRQPLWRPGRSGVRSSPEAWLGLLFGAVVCARGWCSGNTRRAPWQCGAEGMEAVALGTYVTY